MADHALVAPGETSIHDAHHGSTRPDKPRRAPRAKTATEKQFLALGEVAEAFLLGAAAAGVAKLPGELAEILTLRAAHGEPALLAALGRAVAFRRWRADDVRSILAAGGATPGPAAGRSGAGAHPAHGADPTVVGLRDRRTAVSTAPPPLAPDLTAGLRRLKLAAMRRLAPELLRTLVEAEIAARDESNGPQPDGRRSVPGGQDSGRVRPGQLLHPPGDVRLPGLAGMDPRRGELLFDRPAGTGKSHVLVALGVAAVEAGHRVRYFTAADLMETLYRRSRTTPSAAPPTP